MPSQTALPTTELHGTPRLILRCGSFARSGLKYYMTQSGSRAYEIGACLDLLSGLLQRWLKSITSQRFTFPSN
jgi:hypothetical protein